MTPLSSEELNLQYFQPHRLTGMPLTEEFVRDLRQIHVLLILLRHQPTDLLSESLKLCDLQ